MRKDREAIRVAIADLRAKLDVLSHEIEVEPFGSSYDGTLRTQTNISLWSRKHLAPKMADLMIATQDAGCDTPPNHTVVSGLADAIDTVLVDHYHDAFEDVQERAAAGRTAYGRGEIDADRLREYRDERRMLEAAE